MDKIRVVIVEDSKELCDIFYAHMTQYYPEEIEIVGIANDGKEAIGMLVELKPDIALIDIRLPVLDGIGVLEKLKSLYLTDKICCIILSAINAEEITRKAFELGAKYYMLKPYDGKDLINRIIQIYTDSKTYKSHESNLLSKANSSDPFGNPDMNRIIKEDPDRFSTYLLQLVGIPPNLTGYYYLRSALVHCINDKSMLNGVTKILYPTIGKKFNTTGPRVERSIRHAIIKAWEKEGEKNYYRLLNKKYTEESSKPSNSVFIMEIVDYYMLFNN